MKEQKCVFTTMITVKVPNDYGQIVLARMLVFKPSPEMTIERRERTYNRK